MTSARSWQHLELRPNPDPRYTIEHVEHQGRYGIEYGCVPSAQDIADQLTKIGSGQPDRRHHLGTECYDLVVDGDEVGSLVVLDGELLVAVFDPFAGRGIGSAAVQALLAQPTHQRLVAKVRDANPNKARVVRMLERAGFQQRGTNHYGEIELVSAHVP